MCNDIINEKNDESKSGTIKEITTPGSEMLKKTNFFFHGSKKNSILQDPLTTYPLQVLV